MIGSDLLHDKIGRIYVCSRLLRTTLELYSMHVHPYFTNYS